MADHPPPPLLDSPPQGAEDPDINTRLTRVEVVVQDVIGRMDRMQAVMDNGFAEIRTDHRQLRVGFDELRRETTAALESQRKDMLAALEAQRKDMTSALDAQRKEMTAALDSQRREVSAAIDVQRKEVTAAIDKIRDDNLSAMRLTFTTMAGILLALLGKVLNIY
ncbi:Atg14 domain-containing protein [Massilia sp. erpn]|uniref:Atg14 domain-containing protein n=1 Tax=Massilia sp. erpn TaxID=2738142 RepID=UPI002102AC35|nr:Atg14 domain-containing protein [Massilia sp. erpn]UTY60384.1 hypothetical protein HPQ68_26250 [Massilia sp. erpn]